MLSTVVSSTSRLPPPYSYDIIRLIFIMSHEQAPLLSSKELEQLRSHKYSCQSLSLVEPHLQVIIIVAVILVIILIIAAVVIIIFIFIMILDSYPNTVTFVHHFHHHHHR